MSPYGRQFDRRVNGNARPLFLRNRVFALLGYEIVEGELNGGRIRESRRINYSPRSIKQHREEVID